MLSLPPLAAEPLFHLGHLLVTNTLVNAFLATLIFAVFAFFINLGIKKYYLADRAPKGVLNFFESLVEIFLTQIDNVTKDRKKTLQFFPIIAGVFLFILVSNWMSQIPGTGSFGIFRAGEFIPLLRPATSDLNLTLGMAVFFVVLSHILGIITIGFFKYANKFIKLGDIWQAVKTGKPMKIFVSLIELFVGLLEVISEVAKMVSLSLRLFGNIFAGEVLLTVMASLLAFILPLPFLGLELLVGIIQAMVFALLTLVYLSIATTPVTVHAAEH